MSTLFESLFELAPDAILVVDSRGVIARVNAQAAEMFGYERAELVGQAIETLVPERVRADHVRERQSYEAEPRTRRMGADLDLRGRRRDGSEFPVEVALAPIAADDGRFTLAIARDVTVARTAEEALRRAHDELERRVAERTRELSEANRRLVEEQTRRIQSEKLSSIGSLAAGVAHEINNPLSGAMGLVKSLRDGGVPEGRREAYFDVIRDGLERIGNTVRSLLDFAQPRADLRIELDAVDVATGCIRLVAPTARKRAVDIEVRPPPGPAPVLGDRSQLMQAMVNLLMNAIEAAPSGTVVTLAIDADDRLVSIRISDRGPGIPPENLGLVTNPFFSTKPEGEGAGLGLTTALGIVHAHGGELRIESDVGTGTAVTIALPRFTTA
jgi:PAS domain S-box-containing protein